MTQRKTGDRAVCVRRGQRRSSLRRCLMVACVGMLGGIVGSGCGGGSEGTSSSSQKAIQKAAPPTPARESARSSCGVAEANDIAKNLERSGYKVKGPTAEGKMARVEVRDPRLAGLSDAEEGVEVFCDPADAEREASKGNGSSSGPGGSAYQAVGPALYFVFAFPGIDESTYKETRVPPLDPIVQKLVAAGTGENGGAVHSAETPRSIEGTLTPAKVRACFAEAGFSEVVVRPLVRGYKAVGATSPGGSQVVILPTDSHAVASELEELMPAVVESRIADDGTTVVGMRTGLSKGEAEVVRLCSGES